MDGVVLKYYREFSCLADRCEATCCAGWKIVVDPEAYERFQKIEPEWLRGDILSHIHKKEGVYCFENLAGGRCAMLDEDGLCRIQRNTSEEMLCNTCRKFPRLTAAINGDIWISLAASCPAVSRYLLHDSVEWITLQGERICLEDLSVWKEGKSALQLLSAAYPHEDPDFDSFVNVSMECLDIILAFPECRYLEDSFDFYEWENDEAACDLIRRFVANTGQWWKQYYDNYMRYRILSRYLEYPQEMNTERIHQVLGELLLLRVICCSRFACRGSLGEQDILDAIHWVYRFSANKWGSVFIKCMLDGRITPLHRLCQMMIQNESGILTKTPERTGCFLNLLTNFCFYFVQCMESEKNRKKVFTFSGKTDIVTLLPS